METICSFDASGFDGLVRLVEERSGAGYETIAGCSSQWSSLWNRLWRWFVSQPRLPSNLELLRERTRTAIARRLEIVSNSDDQQRRSGLAVRPIFKHLRGGLRRLRRMPKHICYEVSGLGLCPARHLLIDDAAIDHQRGRKRFRQM